MGEIVFADSDEMSDLEPTVINVVQKDWMFTNLLHLKRATIFNCFPTVRKVMVVCPVEIMMQLSIMI